MSESLAKFEILARVELPEKSSPPFEVFVNGIPQANGSDYRIEGGYLLFSRSYRQEGNLGFWRWLSMFIGIAGTYRQNDSVDITFDREGKRLIESALPIDVRTDAGEWVASGDRPATA